MRKAKVRYELKYGKFGAYIYDIFVGEDVDFETIVLQLNTLSAVYEEIKYSQGD